MREVAGYYVNPRAATAAAGGCFGPAMGWLLRKDAASAAVLESAAKKQPVFLITAAGILKDAGRADGAALLAAEAEKSSVRMGRGLEELALLYQDMGRYPESLSITRGLLAADPENPRLNNDLGVLLVFLKRDTEAEAALIKAANHHRAPVSAQLNLAALYARRGDKARAADYYRLALDNPALPAAQRAAVSEAAAGRF